MTSQAVNRNVTGAQDTSDRWECKVICCS